jgi:hypothetical protein
LAHHPDRGHRLLVAGQYVEKWFGHAYSGNPVIDNIIPDTPRRLGKNKFVCRQDVHFRCGHFQ